MTLDEIDDMCKKSQWGQHTHGAARRVLPKLLEVAYWAQTALEQYGHTSDYQDPMHQLAVALREFEEKEHGT
jgi:hypothetical protein